jgi:hypothetical protein
VMPNERGHEADLVHEQASLENRPRSANPTMMSVESVSPGRAPPQRARGAMIPRGCGGGSCRSTRSEPTARAGARAPARPRARRARAARRRRDAGAAR